MQGSHNTIDGKQEDCAEEEEEEEEEEGAAEGQQLRRGQIPFLFLHDRRSLKTCKRDTSYSRITIQQVEERLGIRLDEVNTVPIHMLVRGRLDAVDKQTMEVLKEAVYMHLLQYVNIEGYPTEVNPYFRGGECLRLGSVHGRPNPRWCTKYGGTQHTFD